MKPSTNFGFLIIVLAIFSALVFSLSGQLVDLRDPGADGDSTTTESDSGLEFINNELTIIRGCSANEILQWDETNDEWECAANVAAPRFVGIADHTNNNAVGEETLVPAGQGTVIFGANTLAVGDTLHFIAMGYYGTMGGAPGTLTMRLDLGGTDIISHTHALDAGLGNDEFWHYEALVTIRSLGVAGSLMAQGNYEHTSDNPATDEWHAAVTRNTATSAIDTTVANTLGFTNQFSVADPANTITLTHFLLQDD